jgi:hypothetical protein
MADLNGKLLAKRHGLEVKHSLYRKLGNWYHILKKFPGVLFDSHGYLIFETQEEFEKFVIAGHENGVRQYFETNTLTIKNGIKNVIGYIPFWGDYFPGELSLSEKYWEGAVQTVLVNRYERDPTARKECIKI